MRAPLRTAAPFTLAVEAGADLLDAWLDGGGLGDAPSGDEVGLLVGGLYALAYRIGQRTEGRAAAFLHLAEIIGEAAAAGFEQGYLGAGGGAPVAAPEVLQ